MSDRSAMTNGSNSSPSPAARAQQLLEGCAPKVEARGKTARRRAAGSRGSAPTTQAIDDSRRSRPSRRPMALVALGVTGGIGAYKAVEVARGLQKRGPRRRGGDDALGAPLRRPGHVRGDHAAAGHHRPVGAAAPTPTSSTSRSRPTCGAAAGRAGHRQHHRQVRPRHRRRLPDLAVPRDARAGAARAGDEHQHARAPGGAGEPATLAARGVRFVEPGERLSRLRLDRQGPARRARRRSSRRPLRIARAAEALAGGRACS